MVSPLPLPLPLSSSENTLAGVISSREHVKCTEKVGQLCELKSHTMSGTSSMYNISDSFRGSYMKKSYLIATRLPSFMRVSSIHKQRLKCNARVMLYERDVKINSNHTLGRLKILEKQLLYGNCSACNSSNDMPLAERRNVTLWRRFCVGINAAFKPPRDRNFHHDFTQEIAVIALPALAAQALDPLAQLVETAYIGRIGAVELAAVGVSISAFNIVSKMLNIPLLNITTSFVAEDDASRTFKEANGQYMIVDANYKLHEEAELVKQTNKRVIPAISSALVLGIILGILEGSLLAFGGSFILNIMGLPKGTPMRALAEKYLTLRAIGAPAVVISLVIQGVFRGLKDTKTPLYATLASNILNLLLDSLLIFGLGFGIKGAALATVASQYAMAIILLRSLNKYVLLIPPTLNNLRFDRFLKSGGLLLGRTLAILLTITLATSMAARQGAVSMAAHQICMQIWLAASLLSDSLALAGQTLIAGAMANGEFGRAKDVAFWVLKTGLALGFLMSMILGVFARTFTNLFTKDPSVLAIIGVIMPFVAGTQPINSLAFVFDGLHYGASDFAYAAYSMMVTALLSSVVLLLAPPIWGLSGVWIGVTFVMSLRMIAGVLRLVTAGGPWRFLKSEVQENKREN
ncbi:hypothetical protein O6H91_06G085200 [Diphasiastrum complanatum]|uniref:Uncharacterized protein n=1 Tax=Diphasiastrum complanatum TaxID=34168 RepID=A0ACC2DG36_DIPCM|nr:hypothetical protein O6H91_06G085200 [Diphasiastrum complanatum]